MSSNSSPLPVIGPSLLSGNKLTDLPFGLQTYIFSFLDDERHQRSIKLTPDDADNVAIPPSDLLSVALASSTFPTAVAESLGPRATSLKSSINEVAKNRLSQWVNVLAPFVKAVRTGSSLEFSNVLCKLARGEEENAPASTELPYYVARKFLHQLYRNTVELFKSLSRERISLEVLEIVDIPFHTWQNREEVLLTGLVSALERSCESLKQLALPVTRVCAQALAKVTLRSLNVMKLERHQLGLNLYFLTSEKSSAAEAFLQMLRALDGHADRSKKTNKFRELHLVNMNEAPCIDVAESDCTEGLFNAVRTLRLDINECSRPHHDSITVFTSLFRNLECLHTNGMLRWRYLRMISGQCANIRELHLCPDISFRWNPTNFAGENNPVWEVKTSKLGKIFAVSDGKIKTLVIHGKPTTEHLKLLGEINPGLGHLGMEIGLGNVEGLKLLLGSHCKRVRKLDLSVVADNYDVDGLGREGWLKFTEAVCSASDELCEVSIRLDDDSLEQAGVVPVLQSMLDVIEFLGQRARKISFGAASEVDEDFYTVFDILTRILRSCSTQTENLKVLEIDFYVSFSVDNWDGDEYKGLYRQFLLEKRKLSEKLPASHIRLRGIDNTIQSWFDLMEA